MSTYNFDNSSGGVVITKDGNFLQAFTPKSEISFRPNNTDNFIMIYKDRSVLHVYADDSIFVKGTPVEGSIKEKIETIAGLFLDNSIEDSLMVSSGTNPEGQLVTMPVSGTPSNMPIITTLLANETLNSGWIPTSGYGGLLYVIKADKQSASPVGVMVEFSDDGVTGFPAGAGFIYDSVNVQVQRVLVPKGKYTRITYTNGNEDQVNPMRFEVKLSTTLVQPSESSLNIPLTDTVLGMVVKAEIELKDVITNAYGKIKRVNDALKVKIDDSTPIPVLVNNPTTFPTSIAVSNFPAQPVFPSSIQVSNLPANQIVSGSVSITNLPSSQNVVVTNTPTVNIGTVPSIEISNDSGSPIPVNGTLNAIVTNLPVTQAVTGPLTDTQLRANPVPVSVTFPGVQPVSGTIAVSNPGLTDTQLRASALPVSVNNFPATQAVTGAFWPTTQPVSGTVGISGTVTTTSTIPNPTGTHGNAFNNTATSVIGINSNSVDVGGKSTISIFGTTGALGLSLAVQLSVDNTNFYTFITYTLPNGNFGYNITSAARYIRLVASGLLSTITATIVAK